LALSQTELRELSGADVRLLDNGAGNITSAQDIKQLCARIRHVFRAGTGDNACESTD